MAEEIPRSGDRGYKRNQVTLEKSTVTAPIIDRLLYSPVTRGLSLSSRGDLVTVARFCCLQIEPSLNFSAGPCFWWAIALPRL